MKDQGGDMKWKSRFVICGFTVVVLILALKFWFITVALTTTMQGPIVPMMMKNKTSEVERDVTLVLRYTPDMSNYLLATIDSFLRAFPHLSIVVVCDTTLKKPIMSNISNILQVKVVPLKIDLLSSDINRNMESYLKTKYILIAPVGVSSPPAGAIYQLIESLESCRRVSFLSIPLKGKKKVECLNLQLELIQWTIEYRVNPSTSLCDAIKGDHGIFTKTQTFKKIGEPFMLPFPEALYIQASVFKMKTKMLKKMYFKDCTTNILDNALTMNIQVQRHVMYQNLKIKKVVRETGVTEWYGCTRETPRCFGDVVESVPDYLHQGRWTPPCCLRVLRETARHVFKILKDYNVTFWLEGGSLLGAMRLKDIIPWDYDVDVGIYSKDIIKCPWLKALQSGKFKEGNLMSVYDDKGYLWEKSLPEEGDFFRVQASAKNRLHVDIFPFYSKNGMMTKETWFSDHPQDKEFPEHYLKPLTTIEFAGIEAPAPNNIKEFLELKFGKGCVENPEYPNPKFMTFPEDMKKYAVINETKNYDA